MAILNLWYSINKSGDTITIVSKTGLPINIKVSVLNKDKIEKEKLQNLYDYLYQENFIKEPYRV